MKKNHIHQQSNNLLKFLNYRYIYIKKYDTNIYRSIILYILPLHRQVIIKQINVNLATIEIISNIYLNKYDICECFIQDKNPVYIINFLLKDLIQQ